MNIDKLEWLGERPVTEEQALKIAFGWFQDVTDGRPSPEEAAAAHVLKRMYQKRRIAREKRAADKLLKIKF